MSSPAPSSSPRVLVIGLDGATFRLIKPLVEAGQLPILSRLMREGAAGVLRSTIQPSSEQAWSSFMTGTNNGKHGVFGFQRRVSDSYQFSYVNARNVAGRSLWQRLSEAERDVIAINVPMTYPPEPVRGVLIGGLLSPGEQSRFTYPDGIYAELVQHCGDYHIDVDIERGRMDEAQLLALADDAVDMIHKRTCATLHLADTRPWDFLMVVYGASDRLAHKFWKYWDPGHPLHDPDQADTLGDVLPRIYRELDTAVGELIERLEDENTTLFIISDHGFGPMEKAVYLNRWLAQKGYLHFKADGTVSPRQRAAGMMRAGLRRGVKWLDNPLVNQAKRQAFARLPGLKGTLYSSVAFGQVDWTRTQAYALGTMGNIYLNRQGREPDGIVAGGEEAERLSTSLMAELGRLLDPDTGEPVFHAIHRGADLYHGPNADAAPDIVCVKDSRYHVVTADWQGGDEIVVALGDKMHFVSDQSGQHELDGILIAWGRNILPGADPLDAQLVDLVPTILHTLDQPIPGELDGRVLISLFDPEWLRAHPLRYVDAEDQAPPPASASASDDESEEEAIVRQRLAGLGYLD